MLMWQPSHLFPLGSAFDKVRDTELTDGTLEFWMEEMYWWLLDMKIKRRMVLANDNEDDDR
jgi:hypothetical protein